jgi:hypothetical protein
MMARWTHRRERGFSIQGAPGSLDCRTCSVHCGIVAVPVHHRVRIEPAAAGCGYILDAVEVVPGVNGRKQILWRGLGIVPLDRNPEHG